MSRKSIPPAYVVWRAGTSNRVVVPARQAGNRFLGSLKDVKIRALAFGLKFKDVTNGISSNLDICLIVEDQ